MQHYKKSVCWANVCTISGQCRPYVALHVFRHWAYIAPILPPFPALIICVSAGNVQLSAKIGVDFLFRTLFVARTLQFHFPSQKGSRHIFFIMWRKLLHFRFGVHGRGIFVSRNLTRSTRRGLLYTLMRREI